METAHTIHETTPPSFTTTTSNLKTEAEKIVGRHIGWALGGGLIPVPFVDIAAVTAVQVDMLKKLSKLYDIEFSEASGRSWISTLLVNSATHIGASMFKAMPGVGTLGGGLMMSGLSGASTYGIGQVAIRHFENGGTMSDMDSDQYADYFTEKVEEGREFVRNKTGFGRKNPKPEPESTYQNPVKRMEDLQKLKDMGAISDEEYATMKAKILGEI